jgi:hypothetical protein
VPRTTSTEGEGNVNGNLVSVSWGDHLEWGRGDARLATPDAIGRSVEHWQRDLDAGTILWREHRSLQQLFRFFRDPAVSVPARMNRDMPADMDEQQVVIDAAHDRGMKAVVYTTIFDEGWPASLGWWGGLEAFQSKYVLFHPDHQLVDRKGDEYLHGVLCLAYPEARQYLLGKVLWLVSEHAWDGVFLCTRSQSRPASHGDRYGFNPPIVKEYERRHGVDILAEDFDLDAWRRLQGEGLTLFLREVKEALEPMDLPLSVGIPRSDYLGPPVGNLYLDWRTWVRDGIVDDLVIDQVAAVCPSTWLTMWPRDKGYGYIDNHTSRHGRVPVEQAVATTWGPEARAADAGLYLARMWHEIDRTRDQELVALPGVGGLVYSSFRADRDRGVSTRGLWPG